MAEATRLPTLRVAPEAIASRVLVVGDPARAAAAASLLDSVEQVGSNREFVTYTGSRGDQSISVCSHGVGSAGAGICFEELARADSRVLLRAGTCGAVQEDIADGDLVIASGAVRDEGLTPRLVPPGYPAVADHQVVAALERVAARRRLRWRTGLALCTDLFYPSAALGLDWRPWQNSRVQAVEMELAPLFVVSTLHGIRAGGILTVDGNPTRSAEDMSDYDPYRRVVEEGVSRMLEIAIEALAEIEEAA